MEITISAGTIIWMGISLVLLIITLELKAAIKCKDIQADSLRKENAELQKNIPLPQKEGYTITRHGDGIYDPKAR